MRDKFKKELTSFFDYLTGDFGIIKEDSKNFRAYYTKKGCRSPQTFSSGVEYDEKEFSDDVRIVYNECEFESDAWFEMICDATNRIESMVNGVIDSVESYEELDDLFQD